MRFVLFADLHLDAAFKWAQPEVARRRRQALRDTLSRILALAEEVRADAILCAGDLYEHERFTPDTREFLRETLGSTTRRVVIAPGNHDWHGPPSLYAQVDWPANVHVFREDRLTPLELDAGLTLWGAAFRAPTRAMGFFDDGFAADRGGVNLALFHGTERAGLPEEITGKQPHAPFDAPQIERAGLRHAFLGHLHKPRDEELFTYPGNPDPLTFGETGDRGVVVVEVGDDGVIRRERRRVAASQVHDVVLDITGCASMQEIRDRAAARLAGIDRPSPMAGPRVTAMHVVQLTLQGELAASVDLDLDVIRRLPHGLDELVVRARGLAPGYDLAALCDEPTIRGRFVKDVLEASDLDEQKRQKVLITGLRALDGRSDLAVP